ncbi:MAG: conjugal transfer protein TraG N-terminal domain-containing protein [Sulfuritalea sp.]|nr:conjugal transfer protein TraG N-terminal domain-containing protein [Sulfuritalea sp.]
MDFTIYTFGDVEVFRAALAGVAMIFDSTGFFVGEGGVGLGALAGLGLLLGLMVMLIQGVIDQKVALGGFVMAIVLFVILFVPKFSVNIEDYNGDAIAKVDNVPLGVAMPAALVSGLAREMNIRMGTAFSTVDGYPSGLNTPGALTSPLKMLLALRGGAPHSRDLFTREMSNLQNLVAYCVAGRNNNYNAWISARIADNSVDLVLAQAAAAKGLTMYAEAGATDASLMSCETAAGKLEKDLGDFMLPSGKSTAVMTAAAATTGAAPVKIINNKAMVEPITVDAQDTAMQMLFQSSSTDAYNFMKMAMFMPSINKAFDCASASGDPRSWAQCLPFQQAVVQYSEDAAAAGTFFQRLMFHGMNALFFLWICLSPVVAMVMLIMGIRGMKLAGSYLMFGAWAVSWYVGASIVNFYMLKQVQYEVAMLGQISGLTQTGIGQFFDVLQNKIAVSGDMMASVPLIMMTVMSGSVYGMVQLASRWGAKDYYDQGINSPAYVGSNPIGTRQAAMTSIMGRPGMEMAGYREAGSINLSDGLSGQVSAQQATVDQKTHTLQQSFAKALSHSLGSTTTGEHGGDFSNRLASSGMHRLGAVNDLAHSIAKSNGYDEKQTRNLQESLSAKLGIQLPGSSVHGISLGAQADTTLSNIKTDALSASEKETLQLVQSRDSSFIAGINSEMSSGNIARFVEAGSDSSSLKNDTTWGNTFQEAQSYTESYSTLQSLTHQQALSQQIGAGDVARQLMAEPEGTWSKAIDKEHEKHNNSHDPAYQAAVSEELAALKQTNLLALGNEKVGAHALEQLAELKALARVDPAGFSAVASVIAGHGSGMTAPSGGHAQEVVDQSAARNLSGFDGTKDPSSAARGTMGKGKAIVDGGTAAVGTNYASQSAASNLPDPAINTTWGNLAMQKTPSGSLLQQAHSVFAMSQGGKTLEAQQRITALFQEARSKATKADMPAIEKAWIEAQTAMGRNTGQNQEPSKDALERNKAGHGNTIPQGPSGGLWLSKK